MNNAEKTRINFKDNDNLYIPINYKSKSSKRAIVMEYIEGVKINEINKLKEIYGDP